MLIFDKIPKEIKKISNFLNDDLLSIEFSWQECYTFIDKCFLQNISYVLVYIN